MKFEDFEKRLKTIIKNPAAYGIVECALCGREQIAMVGVWFLEGEAAKRAKQPEGKQRTIFYGMCEECGSKGQESANKIEEEFFKDLDAGKEIDMLT